MRKINEDHRRAALFFLLRPSLLKNVRRLAVGAKLITMKWGLFLPVGIMREPRLAGLEMQIPLSRVYGGLGQYCARAERKNLHRC